MPLAHEFVKATIEPTATDESGSMGCMAHPSSDPTSPLYQRLEHVLRLLGKSWRDLYKETSLGQDYISKLKSGRLGKERPQKLAMEMQTAYGVPFEVWTADRMDWKPVVQNSATLSKVPSSEGTMGTMTGPQVFVAGAVDLRRELARVAAELDEPKEVVLELLSVEPPADADRDWWFRQYVEIVRKARRPLRR